MTWTQAPKAVREAVFARDGAICRTCGATTRLDIDHVIPVSNGGSDDLENLQVLCRPCNSRKGGVRPKTKHGDYGPILGQLRQSKGWTQEELARRLGVARVTVARWETGKRTPDKFTVRAIARALGVKVADLDLPEHRHPPEEDDDAIS